VSASLKGTDMETYRGAEIVVRLLEQQDVRTVVGIPGGANLPLYDALATSGAVRHVLARHEQGAGFIAQGMARASGVPAVCLASSGPGATNLLTAIADAKLDSVPLIAITGQVPRALLGTDAFQEVDTYGLSIPITKHNFLVSSAAELLDVVPRAFSIAMSGRPGPVLIDIPKDVQNEQVPVDRWPAPASRCCGGGVDDALVDRAAELIDGARRPVLYLGGGVVHSGASSLAVMLAEKASIPAVMTLMALGTLPFDHRLALGMLGMHAAPYTNRVVDEADLLIAIGARFDDRATGKLAEFCPHAKVIHVDIDAAELNKLRPASVAIAADVAPVLEALLARVKLQTRSAWLARVADLRLRFPLEQAGIDCPRSHYGLIAAVARCLDDDAIVCTDVGQHQMWVAQSYPFRRPRAWLTSGGLGTMGFGLPAAIGAALAEPRRTVVCFSGDGSLLMNVQELATLADENLNVKIVLLNNSALGLVHQQQSLFYGGRVFASRYVQSPRFAALAAAFGIGSMDLDRCADTLTALRDALQAPGPCLIHASIDVEHNVLPMVPPGAANRDMIGA
jgi:acetolactate synthase-1/2/3 large subunit